MSYRISFDMDNTLTKYPELLVFAIFLKRMGHEVGILSGRRVEDLPTKEMGWDFIIGCPVGEKSEITGEPWKTDEEKAREWKPSMIRKHKIDIHFDDLADYILEGNVEGAKVIKV